MNKALVATHRLGRVFGELKGLATSSSLQMIRGNGLLGYWRAIKHEPWTKRLSYLWACLSSDSFKREILGYKMRLDISMGYYGGLQRALLVYGWYEPQFTRVITQELKEGMTVVDIGANVGYYVLLEAEIVGDTGKVYAIEPVPEIVERLKENVSLNSLTNVEIYQLAIGNRNSKTKCYLSKSPNLSNLLGTTEKSGPKSRYIGTIEVAETTLDDFLKDKRAPDLVRMDIEGYEYFAIEGGEKLLSEKRNMKIFMELHPRDMEKAGLKLEVMLDRLYHVGFKPKYLTKKGDSWLNPLSDSIDINSSRFEGSLADLLRKIEHADGLFMEKVI